MLLLPLLLFTSFPLLINASSGDISPFFRHCLANCTLNFGCSAQHPMAFDWWARERCFSCRQKCVWGTVSRFRRQGYGTPQFFGKWPFLPLSFHIGPFFMAIQEPASVLFSLLNLYTVLAMQRRVRRAVPLAYHCRAEWIRFGWVAAIAWSFSALFHTCDHRLTEALDYGSALGLILFSLFASISFIGPFLQSQIRLLNGSPIRISRGAINSIGAAIFVFYIRYMSSMLQASRFDYAYHIRFCVSLSLLTASLYLAWALTQIWMGKARKSLAFLMAAFLLGFFSAAFDAFIDFPPLFWTLDAHAFFHLFSIPVPLFWAEFICSEAVQAEEIGGEKSKHS